MVAQPQSHHGLTLRPEYKFFSLRDRDLDARVGAGQAIEDADRTIAAATPYEVWVVVAQLDLPVRAEVEVWETMPATPPASADWSLVDRFELPFPSADPVLGDGSGQAISGPWLPLGPGNYLTELWCAGRDQAQRAAAEIDHVTEGMSIFDKIAYQNRHGADIERYLFRLAWLAQLPDDDEDDD